MYCDIPQLLYFQMCFHHPVEQICVVTKAKDYFVNLEILYTSVKPSVQTLTPNVRGKYYIPYIFFVKAGRPVLHLDCAYSCQMPRASMLFHKMQIYLWTIYVYQVK
jgi:hypothetical protein